MQTVAITVKGKVQGVFYRQSTRETATRLGLTGEVKNLRNGDVYIIATGTAGQLEQLAAWCHTGPSRAVVSDVIVEDMPLQAFTSFSVMR